MSQAKIRLYRPNVTNTSQRFSMNGAEISSRVRIRNYARGDGKSQVLVVCYVKGTKVVIPTGINIEKKYFNVKNEEIRRSHPEALDLNLLIQDILNRIHEIRVKQRLGDIDISPSTFKDMVLLASITADFLGYMIYRVEVRKNELAYNTFRHHKATHGLMVQCFQSLPFSELNDENIFKFRRFMERRGAKETTISDKIKHLKIYLHLAKKEGLKFKMPTAKALKVVQPPSSVQALNREQLKQAIELYKKQYLEDGPQQVLRLFLFSCFSGIRYGDIASLTHENFVDKTVIITPQKTKRLGKLLKIPLPSIALALIDKEDERPLGKVISNQKINANLKKIKAYLGMSKGSKLHFHMSRHTFATQFLELGGNIEVLQTLLGHSSLKQTMIYAHVVDKRRETQMDNFNNLFVEDN